MKIPSTLLLLLTTTLPLTTAECCGDSITGCRGYGECNVFCCNCDAVYREDWALVHHPILCRIYVDDGGPACNPNNEHDKKSKRRFSAQNIPLSITTQDQTVADTEMLHDASAGTGQMSMYTFIAYSESKGMTDRAILEARFKEHDRNDDGVITIDEMRLK
ncbi:hypothetical protein E6O75_ATG11364 [Venturia nashicola]|uniref:EF-hand domain-containing protein n=1 Tax=Venturia nashicola TaxID=86259 RepID=A0A4Z1NL60_9PEZI|nr:hypothetical protein E6O75_ATG11364 [Venturia nashicola]